MTRKQAVIVALMFTFSVMSYFSRTIISIAGPVVTKEFALTEVQMGSVYSAFLWGYALFMVPGGALADRLGPRWVLTIMALGSAAFTMLTALGGALASFLLIRLGLGIFTAPLYPASGRMNANWMTPAQRGRTQGWVNAGAGLGGAVSPLLFAAMIASYGWRISFVLAGLATAALGAMWFVSTRDRPDGKPRMVSRPTSWSALLKDRNLMLLTLGMGTVSYFEYIFFYWIYYYLGEVRGLGPNASAMYTSGLFLMWLVMTPFGGWACDKLLVQYGARGLRIVAVGGLLVAVFLLIAGINTQQTQMAVALMSLSLGSASCSDVAYWATAIHIGGNQVGAATGILNTGSNVGGSFAPVLTAFIASGAGWHWGLYFGCLVAMAGMLVWLWIEPEGSSHA